MCKQEFNLFWLYVAGCSIFTILGVSGITLSCEFKMEFWAKRSCSYVLRFYFYTGGEIPYSILIVLRRVLVMNIVASSITDISKSLLPCSQLCYLTNRFHLAVRVYSDNIRTKRYVTDVLTTFCHPLCVIRAHTQGQLDLMSVIPNEIRNVFKSVRFPEPALPFFGGTCCPFRWKRVTLALGTRIISS